MNMMLWYQTDQYFEEGCIYNTRYATNTTLQIWRVVQLKGRGLLQHIGKKMIEIGTRVRIKTSGITGYVVDIIEKYNIYTVECEKTFDLHDCAFDDVETI